MRMIPTANRPEGVAGQPKQKGSIQTNRILRHEQFERPGQVSHRNVTQIDSEEVNVGQRWKTI
jgi:hypothetical protein